MSSEIIEQWLKSGKSAFIGPHCLVPIENNILRGKPLSSQKGQAEAFFTKDNQEQWWILKKFHPSCQLNTTYLQDISKVLPNGPGFHSGTDRLLLSKDALKKDKGNYFNKELATWLEGTVLMPRVRGADWATLADDLRSGDVVLDIEHRLTLCKRLAELVEMLEQAQCSHRDLSCGNVFIDTTSWTLVLIDFDSLFHPNLVMPKTTTCGTLGYTSHLIWGPKGMEAQRSWGTFVDRYAMTLLNIEFILIDQRASITGEGGIFDQNELQHRTGSGLNRIMSELQAKHSTVAGFLLRTLNSASFSDLPSPQEWIAYCDSILGPGAPSLTEIPMVSIMDMAAILAQCRPPAPLWPTPSLQDMPLEIPSLPQDLYMN